MFSQYNRYASSMRNRAQHPKAQLPFYAVMLLVLWVMFASQFSKNLDFSDDSSRVRVEQERELNTDNDSNLDDFPTFDGILPGKVLFDFATVIGFTLAAVTIIVLRNCLTQIRSRSPPPLVVPTKV